MSKAQPWGAEDEAQGQTQYSGHRVHSDFGCCGSAAGALGGPSSRWGPSCFLPTHETPGSPQKASEMT